MAINWDTVATSAATAVVVTSMYDYFVRPRQEARKERIAEQLRARRELLAVLAYTAQSASVVLLEPPPDATTAVLEKLRDQRQRQYERMQEHVQSLFDDVTRYASTYVLLPRDVLIECVCCMQGVLMSSRSRREQARLLHAFTYQLAVIFSYAGWRLIARGKALMKTRRLLGEVACDGTTAAAPSVPTSAG
ncbi:hypothetical protein [Planomonospora sp. ID82291]|uniref:hypothetical protein n=1 Tax=Planomonospora sp. ID82291 TaxID=2738136 RepID=UPI0018C37666|nr:hypothetical protein [Planomonospora sp. ID82291]MBG0818776.1 hypothetical protein [Planomonospora sp. ID82291]